mgnify:FL=1
MDAVDAAWASILEDRRLAAMAKHKKPLRPNRWGWTGEPIHQVYPARVSDLPLRSYLGGLK